MPDPVSPPTPPASEPTMETPVLAEDRARADVIITEAKAVAAANINEAARVAEELMNKAASKAQDLIEESEDRTTRSLSTALRDVFGENKASGRFVDVSRIPLLCKSVIDIHENIKEIKTMMKDLDGKYAGKLTEKIVYGLVGLIVTTFIIAMLAMVLQK